MVFGDLNDDRVSEQLLKNLLERLTVERPHPWGVLFLFYKILTNPIFKIEQKPFYIKNKKEIENLIALAFKYAKISDIS